MNLKKLLSKSLILAGPLSALLADFDLTACVFDPVFN